VVTRIVQGEALQQQFVARDFTERFRELNALRTHPRGWRDWAASYSELVDWELRLRDAGEMGLLSSLETLLDDFRRDFCHFITDHYGSWVNGGDDAPSLSPDVIPQFLVPLLEDGGTALFIVIDCLRLDQWRAILPLLEPIAEVEEALYYSILPTATPFSRNAIFSGLYPDEIAERHPEWWATEGEGSLNAYEGELFQEQLDRLLEQPGLVRYEKIFSSAEGEAGSPAISPSRG
jgi:hypothetical protein